MEHMHYHDAAAIPSPVCCLLTPCYTHSPPAKTSHRQGPLCAFFLPSDSGAGSVWLETTGITVVEEPKVTQLSAASVTAQGGRINGRWRWWYSMIADYRISHPGCTHKEIASHLGKHESTVGAIVNTDMYREYEAQRKAAFRAEAEDRVRGKLLSLTDQVLDSMTEIYKKKQDQVPLEVSREILNTGLEGLGFGPKPQPGVIINNQQVNIPSNVSASVLEEARMALRSVEQQRLAPRPAIELEVEPPQESASTTEPAAELGEVRAPSNNS